ncbi:tricarboxylate transporter [Marinomonas sp. CT5]|uniref:tripartite tricarboxylate transporter permease n=1 Tax=Marinomonas sp. CT5 TaxID=2066133 RepID=UPI00183F42A0|nr:tripartite tricarboxylate transporter permease [Marinomonas sp. CT5]NVK73090.1 tripartite tricarboxylate transporter permease [Oceanospirillaceae bacterium]QUX95612.1 tricarboxylate transporter [Marinomonas sp. CT5]
MIEFLSALDQIMSVAHLAYLITGVLVGLVVGIIPGLGGIAGMSLLLPFLYGMEPSVGLGMLMGLVAVIPTGDTFTSVLMGIPGSSSSQATVMDGFPLAKKGQAARALSAAFLSSMIGGVVGAIVLSVFILVARPIVLAFSSAELFMLTLLGLSVVAALSGANVFKGLAACGFGLLIGAIGGAPATGEFRFTLGIDYLYDGVPLVVVGLGIFALPEIISLLVQNRAIASSPNKLGHGLKQGFKDVFANLPLVGKSSVFGSLIGAIPGLGGSVVDWMTYSFAINSSKDTSQFGKGEIRGVIAPESANNACASGSMIPTILFGVPGSGSAAVFLGGMLLLGIQPGVSMISTHLDLTYTIIWSLALANILGAMFCILFTRPISLLTYIKFSVLTPIILTLILFAAYQATRSLGDFLLLGVVAAIGVMMKGANWPRPAFLIGFVLSSGAENYFFQSIQFYGYSWFTRPGVIIIAALIIVGFVLPPILKKKKLKEKPEQLKDENEDTHVKTVSWADWAIIATLAISGTYALIDIWDSSTLTKAFPIIAIAIVLLSVIMVIRGYIKEPHKKIAASLTPNLVYILGFFVIAYCYYLFGFISTTFVFSLLFLRFIAAATYVKSTTIAVCLVIFLVTIGKVMNVDFPEGIFDPYLLGTINRFI